MADISFNIACKELKISQNAQLNQLFQLMHLVHHIYGHGFYVLSRMLMSKNVNNDVSKDLCYREKEEAQTIIFSRLQLKFLFILIDFIRIPEVINSLINSLMHSFLPSLHPPFIYSFIHTFNVNYITSLW